MESPASLMAALRVALGWLVVAEVLEAVPSSAAIFMIGSKKDRKSGIGIDVLSRQFRCEDPTHGFVGACFELVGIICFSEL